MDRYIDIDREQLHKLHDGLEMLEMLDAEAMQAFDLNLYGLTQNPSIIDAAKEAIADSADLSEEDVQLSEVAVAIRLGADTVYAFAGSGIKLKNEEFAYMGSGGEGVRTSAFGFSKYKPSIALEEFTSLALASTSSWLDDFLRQYGNKQPAEIQQNVHRDEEATAPGVPAPESVPPVPSAPPATPAPAKPKQTALLGGVKLTDVLDNFLGGKL